MTSPTLRRRSGTLDSLRGLTLVSMMAYHACWDLVYLYGMPWDWYRSFWAYAWQQSICCTFILLSGYCCSGPGTTCTACGRRSPPCRIFACRGCPL